jgi:hypothetical protein
MIFHFSIGADDPRATAQFLAGLWQGRAYHFPPFGKDSWIAMAGDERNSAIEVYRRGTEMVHGGDDATEVQERIGKGQREAPFHAAIATSLEAAAVVALAKQHGAPARVCDRGPFGVIEVWIDGCTMLEVLTPEMQQQYLGAMTYDGWEHYLEAVAA